LNFFFATDVIKNNHGRVFLGCIRYISSGYGILVNL
jgi:hypothetical protein